MSERIKRKELVHMYENVYSNANGDPNNDNRPRIDEETGYQYVTMYRTKRTIRDTLRVKHLQDNQETNQILYRAEKGEDGKLKDLTTLMLEDNSEESLDVILNKFIDVRLFGGLVGNQTKGISNLQGPVQFSYGKSYHRVKEEEVGLSAVLPSGKDKMKGTLGSQYITPYALIGSDGTINEYNAEKTKLTEEDIFLMLEALWSGTTNLKTSSKNQKSLFMVVVEYKEGEMKYIGELKKYFHMKSNLDDLQIRSTDDYEIEVNDFVNKINNMSNSIEKVIIKRDSSLKLSFKGNDFEWTEILEVPVEEEIV